MLNRSLRSSVVRSASLTALVLGTWASNASASPVLLAGNGDEKVHSTHVSILSSGGTRVVTILPDYQGSLSAFAVIVPVPSDVTSARVNSLKREFIDRVESITAPRFAEFWEMPPCEPGKPEQDWERSMAVGDSPGFLGGVKTDPSTKVAKELLLDVTAQTKEGEYKLSVLSSADDVKKWLSGKNLNLPAGGEASLNEYGGQGYKFLVAEVDVNRIELVGGDRAQLSPIRFWTNESYSKVPARFGLPSAAPKQELFLYTFVNGQRVQVTNYPTKAAPTNLTVDFAVKERMGEFYAALHDKFLEKSPGTFLLEYAYSTADCGKPCPSEPLLPHELMSLGGDVIDSKLSKSELRPAPPEPTEAELAQLEAQQSGKTPQEKAEIKKQWQEAREEIVARKALLARHEYLLTRLHYRYAGSELPQDPELGFGGAVKGGVALPLGQDGAADTTVSAADKNEFQARFNNLHPNIVKAECENPEPYRWGKAPATYRGLRKIWIAEDLSRKNRKQIELEKVVVSPSADLGLAGIARAAVEPGAPAEAPEEKKSESCGCKAAGVPVQSPLAAIGGLLFGLLAWRRRSRV